MTSPGALAAGRVRGLASGVAGRVSIRDTVGLRTAVLAGAVLLAYHFSLGSLVRDLGLDTPLAYLGLVPAMAVGIALLTPRPATERDIHDRQVDLIVGLPLVAAALFAQAVLPGRLGADFWLYRVDLLTLPVFVAGSVSLLFGVRALWRFRVAVGFLLLAWPIPYAWFIDHFLGLTTGSTLTGIRTALHTFHVATPVLGGDGSTFQLVHAGVPYQVSVASSCSGVDGAVGFALVGAAFLAVVQGSRWRKAIWLVTGLALVWVLNLLRILAIFWAGRTWGEKVAVDGLHPVLGLVEFAFAVGVMVLVMPRLRLTVPGLSGPRREGPSLRQRLAAAPRGAGGMKLAGVALLAGVIALFSLDGALTRFQLTAGDFGTPRVVAFDAKPAAVPGYSVSPVAEYAWVSRFFGGGSSWHRFEYSQALGVGGRTPTAVPASLSAPVIVDVIDSKDVSPFNTYGIEACYSFHGYAVHGERTVDLKGAQGHVLTYRDGAQAWDVVYWIWAVSDGHGGKRFERVVLLEPTGSASAGGAQPESSPLQGVGYGQGSGGTASKDEATRTGELVDFARSVVQHAAPVAATPTVTHAATHA